MKKLLLLLPLLLTLFACSESTPPQALNHAPIAIQALEQSHNATITIDTVDYVIADIFYLTQGVDTYREIISIYYISYTLSGSDETNYSAVEIFTGDSEDVNIHNYEDKETFESGLSWYIWNLSDSENFAGEYRVDYTTSNGKLSRNEIIIAKNTALE